MNTEKKHEVDRTHCIFCDCTYVEGDDSMISWDERTSKRCSKCGQWTTFLKLSEIEPLTHINDLIARLERYNQWRRGADIEQPNPTELGKDIDMAIHKLREYDNDVRAAYIKGSNDCYDALIKTERECKE